MSVLPPRPAWQTFKGIIEGGGGRTRKGMKGVRTQVARMQDHSATRPRSRYESSRGELDMTGGPSSSCCLPSLLLPESPTAHWLVPSSPSSPQADILGVVHDSTKLPRVLQPVVYHLFGAPH